MEAEPVLGVPAQVYELTAEADHLFPKAYDDFAAALIEEIKRRRPDELDDYLHRVADRWIARDVPRIGSLEGPEPVQMAKQILAERGFMPVVRDTADGYELREHNCLFMRLDGRA